MTELSEPIVLTVSFDQVMTAEHLRIREQRTHRNRTSTDDQFIGLSISGGGIRSASFALGVLQALNKSKQIHKIDYLSTVSGGGYIGFSWTWFNYLKRSGKIDTPVSEYFFPFGVETEGARTDQPTIQSKILNYIRQHGSYLVPGFGLGYVSAIAVVLRNMLMPLLVYLSLLIVAFTGLHKLEILFTDAVAFESVAYYQQAFWFDLMVIPKRLAMSSHLNLALTLSVICLMLMAGLGIIYGPVTFALSRTTPYGYKIRTAFQRTAGSFAAASMVFGVVGLLPVFVDTFKDVIAASSGGVLGVLGGVWHFLQQNKNNASGIKIQLIAVVSSFLIIVALLSVAYYLSIRFYPDVWLMALPLGLLLGYFISINQFGIGRMYRDRLIETFMPNISTIHHGRWEPATQASVTSITDVCTDEDQGPYHLLNTNVILVDSMDKKYRGRGGDNFILSSLFCGSDATSWTPSSRFNNRDFTLATAMATSGAAANPHAAPNSQGITKNPLVSFLMFILGLRMGLYVINPLRNSIVGLNVANLLQPGLYQGLLGMGFNNKARYLCLSDGGHFENTAVYELIRRCVGVIVVSEAGEDQDFSFADLGNLIEKVRVDFGVHIRFLDDFDLRYLVPGSSDLHTAFTERYGMAKRGFAIADIIYPEADRPNGKLFVVKATIVNDLPADLYGYKDAHPQFPNETTLDQFFGETQVESYRELGYQLATQMTQNDTFIDAFKVERKDELG